MTVAQLVALNPASWSCATLPLSRDRGSSGHQEGIRPAQLALLAPTCRETLLLRSIP